MVSKYVASILTSIGVILHDKIVTMVAVIIENNLFNKMVQSILISLLKSAGILFGAPILEMFLPYIASAVLLLDAFT